MRTNLHFVIDALVVSAGLLPFVVKRRTLTVAWLAVAAILGLVLAVHAERAVAQSIALPPVWDFWCFWLYGRVADLTHQPYEPQAMHAIAASLPYDRPFSREVLDVGFIYPPPTIALFAPLGLFPSPRAAIPFWYALLLVALCLEIVLLWRHFMRDDGWRGFLVTTLLVALFPVTLPVLATGQTLFVAEVFLLLYLRDKSLSRQGIWLALATIVKPFLLVIFLYPLLRREWRALASGFMTVFAVTVAVLPLIGWHSVVSFIIDTPSKRLPDWMLDASSQSLLALVLRLTHRQAHVTAAVHDPLYLLIVGALISVTIWTLVQANGRNRDYSIALLVPVALLVYPATGWTYAEMLLIPICFLWAQRKVIPGGVLLASAFTVVEFVLAEVQNAQVFASPLAWVLLVGVARSSAGQKPSKSTGTQLARATDNR